MSQQIQSEIQSTPLSPSSVPASSVVQKEEDQTAVPTPLIDETTAGTTEQLNTSEVAQTTPTPLTESAKTEETNVQQEETGVKSQVILPQTAPSVAISTSVSTLVVAEEELKQGANDDDNDDVAMAEPDLSPGSAQVPILPPTIVGDEAPAVTHKEQQQNDLNQKNDDAQQPQSLLQPQPELILEPVAVKPDSEPSSSPPPPPVPAVLPNTTSALNISTEAEVSLPDESSLTSITLTVTPELESQETNLGASNNSGASTTDPTDHDSSVAMEVNNDDEATETDEDEPPPSAPLPEPVPEQPPSSCGGHTCFWQH